MGSNLFWKSDDNRLYLVKYNVLPLDGKNTEIILGFAVVIYT